jgi:hypothetical protein
MMQKQENVTPLPGVAATIGAGFELVTRHLWLAAVPVVLDLFLWLGPRLGFNALIEQLIDRLATMPMIVDPQPMLEVMLARTNLFTYLSVALVGVPALMTGLTPEKTPLQPAVVEVTGWGEWAGFFLGLTLVGLLLAAVYYTLIARAVGGPEARQWDNVAVHSGRTFARLIGLSILFVFLMALILIPVSMVGAVLGLLSQFAATIVVLAAPVLLLWLVIFMSYTPQGMALNRRPFFPALLESVRIFQLNLIPASGLLLLVVLITQVMNWLMLSADDGSWLTLASVLGHAFVSTALVTAMFIFYRDRYAVAFAAGRPEAAAEQPKQ